MNRNRRRTTEEDIEALKTEMQGMRFSSVCETATASVYVSHDCKRLIMSFEVPWSHDDEEELATFDRIDVAERFIKESELCLTVNKEVMKNYRELLPRFTQLRERLDELEREREEDVAVVELEETEKQLGKARLNLEELERKYNRLTQINTDNQGE